MTLCHQIQHVSFHVWRLDHIFILYFLRSTVASLIHYPCMYISADSRFYIIAVSIFSRLLKLIYFITYSYLRYFHGWHGWIIEQYYSAARHRPPQKWDSSFFTSWFAAADFSIVCRTYWAGLSGLVMSPHYRWFHDDISPLFLPY